MINKTKIKEFIAYAKICSSKLAYKYVIYTNNGKDTTSILFKLRLVRSYIKALESYVGIPRRNFFGDGCNAIICVRTCLCKKEICNIVNKLKTICNNC